MGNNSKRINHVSNNVNGGKILVNERSKNVTIENLKFLSVNACGLRGKLRFPEFTDLIESYDIIGVQETKLDDLDSICIPGYEIVCKNRNKISRYRSGGLAIAVKSCLFPYITIQSRSVDQYF